MTLPSFPEREAIAERDGFEQRLGFRLPTPAERVRAYADFEQHLLKSADEHACARCGAKGERKRGKTTPVGFSRVKSQLTPASYFLCEACS